MSIFRHFFIATTFSLLMIVSAHAGDEHDIPLKLFGENVLEDYDGCHFALWQKNRDPREDKYSYVFYAPIHDAVQLPGWIKIGDTVHSLERLDNPGEGRSLDRHQLFRDSEGNVTVHMEILEQRDEGNYLIVDDARLTITMENKFPFVSRPKGRMGCPDSAYKEVEGTEAVADNLDGDPISLGKPVNHDSFDAVPKPILQHIRSQLTDICDIDNAPEYASSYAISDAMTLWELPCALYAKNAATVFFTALNDNPNYFALLYAQSPPGLGESDHYDILNASVVPSTGAITSFSMDGPTGSCGRYERHQLRAVEGEAVELLLAEFREKPNCDGVVTEPQDFPLVYRPG